MIPGLPVLLVLKLYCLVAVFALLVYAFLFPGSSFPDLFLGLALGLLFLDPLLAYLSCYLFS